MHDFLITFKVCSERERENDWGNSRRGSRKKNISCNEVIGSSTKRKDRVIWWWSSTCFVCSFPSRGRSGDKDCLMFFPHFKLSCLDFRCSSSSSSSRDIREDEEEEQREQEWEGGRRRMQSSKINFLLLTFLFLTYYLYLHFLDFLWLPSSSKE